MISLTLVRTWVLLVALSGGSALVSLIATTGIDRRLVGVVILVLAFVKARLILAQFLELRQAPDWLSGFSWVIGIVSLLILGLYLAAA